MNLFYTYLPCSNALIQLLPVCGRLSPLLSLEIHIALGEMEQDVYSQNKRPLTQ